MATGGGAEGTDVMWLSGDSAGNLTTIGDVTLANDKKVIFGDAGEHIVGDGTNLNIVSSNVLTLNSNAGGGGGIYLKASGTTFETLESSSGIILRSTASNADIKFRGNDGGSAITALTLDMSDAGSAYFNNKVGIGTTSPQNKLDISATTWDDGVTIKNTGNFNVGIIGDANRSSAGGGLLNLQARWNGTEVAGILFTAGSDTTNKDDGEILFRVASAGTPSEKLRIGTSGRFHTNATTSPNGQLNLIGERGGSYRAIVFEHTSGGGGVGDIRTTSSSVIYNTSSDYRLKENVSYDFDATTRLKQLRPARFNFIVDADTTVDGFLAHEVSSVVPEAISGEKDETETKEKVVVNANGNVIAENIEQADWQNGKIADEDGNTKYPTDSTWEATKVVPVYQGIDQSKLVPLLVKTIQELEARITTLENN